MIRADVDGHNVINAATFSTCRTRVETYPHSLSYHERTLTRSPSTTFVNDKSTMAPKDVPIMSDDTNGSAVTPKTPRHLSSCAALVKTAFTSAVVVGRAATKVKSAKEPAITGTRMAMPSNLPTRLGTARVTDIAAPVVLGTILPAAARPRLKSFDRAL